LHKKSLAGIIDLLNIKCEFFSGQYVGVPRKISQKCRLDR
jgi:hypothetical protein